MVIELAAARRQQQPSPFESSPAPRISLPTRTLGPMIRRVRKQRGWSLIKLQQRGTIYRDISSLSKMEKGLMDIDYATLVVIACTLGDPMLIDCANALVLGMLHRPEVA